MLIPGRELVMDKMRRRRATSLQTKAKKLLKITRVMKEKSYEKGHQSQSEETPVGQRQDLCRVSIMIIMAMGILIHIIYVCVYEF